MKASPEARRPAAVNPAVEPPADHLAASLVRTIARSGPMTVADYMRAANRVYYDGPDPFGRAGDFVTAPEISQMFGELIGLWCADLASRAGARDFAWVELGPGRGTLAADARRAMRRVGVVPDLHLVENSPALRVVQARAVADARWHDNIASLPDDRPLIIVANEFFDALPIRQLIRTADCWAERVVALHDGGFVPRAGGAIPPDIMPIMFAAAEIGAIVETSPAGVAIVRALAKRIVSQGGALLIIDYGYDGPAIGETLQAVRDHGFADPFVQPGDQDLSAHVDLATLAAAAAAAGARAFDRVAQGAFLRALGIEARAAALTAAAPAREEAITAECTRLVGDDAMGRLFRVLTVTAQDWPLPAGVAGSAPGGR